MQAFVIEYPVFWEWLSLAVRWLHVITGIAWIGSSFYFIALVLGLRKVDDLPAGVPNVPAGVPNVPAGVPNLPAGVHGEAWQVHGGGFYHIQKYLVAPEKMPEHLTWFKWESYATWLSGFAMLCIVYYAGAGLYLVDMAVLEISPTTGIAISLASLGLGWIVYDLLCKSPLGRNTGGLMVLLFVVLVAMSWGYAQAFTGRAALLHLGAFTATIMSANVFFIIMPNQRKVIADLIAGRQPNPALGVQAKQRSLHNNYLTLPVLFLMISNHYPLAFATPYNWVIASLVFLMGVTIRHYFNSLHARQGKPLWTWALTALLFVAIMWLSTLPGPVPAELDGSSLSPSSPAFASLTPFEKRLVRSNKFEDLRNTVLGRCSMCHASEPAWDGIVTAPKGVILDSERQIIRHAREIYLQAGRTTAMPPANVTFIEPLERKLIVDWYESIK